MNADPGVRLVAHGRYLSPTMLHSRRDMLEGEAGAGPGGRRPLLLGLDAYKHVIESSDVVLVACAAKYHSVYLAGRGRGRQARVRGEAERHRSGRRPRSLTAACELAKQKKLSVMSGLHSRHDPGLPGGRPANP